MMMMMMMMMMMVHCEIPYCEGMGADDGDERAREA